MEKISVIVPVYNVEHLLKRCLDSLIGQTYENLEIILINDGSTDSSGQICEDYANRYKNVNVYHKENGGQSSARNLGLQKANGEYIGFVDSDDWIHKDMFSHLYNLIKKYNSDVADISAVFATEATSYDDKLDNDGEIIEVYYGKEVLKNFLHSGLSESVGQYAVWRKLYKSSLFNNIKFLEGRIYEDILINFELLASATKIVRSNKVFYYYYQDNLSTTRNALTIKDLDLLYVCKKIVYLTESENLFEFNYLARVKLARSYFSLLAKIAFYGIEDVEINEKAIVKKLTKKLRANYFLLMKSPIPINRKLMITTLCININLLKLPLFFYKKIAYKK